METSKVVFAMLLGSLLIVLFIGGNRSPEQMKIDAVASIDYDNDSDDGKLKNIQKEWSEIKAKQDWKTDQIDQLISRVKYLINEVRSILVRLEESRKERTFYVDDNPKFNRNANSARNIVKR